LKLRITIDGKTYEADVEILEASESAPEYPPYPPAPAAYVPADIPVSLAAPQTSETHNEKECRSPVTGMVISTEAAPGQAVEANQVVMVLESMKMEMQITAPQAAVVKSVLVVPGSSVKVNQLLVEFE
jgi:glutaconyl-CoA/methylmalonyl-CoA decarboxylase subunit gamma